MDTQPTKEAFTEEELLQAIADVVHKTSGIVLGAEQVKGLLIEIQKEQVKSLVYSAFMRVTGQHQQSSQELHEETEAGVEEPK